MIERYSREEIKKIWELDSKFQYYLDIELAVCKAYWELGDIPQESFEKIKNHASFSVNRIAEIEKETHHDVIAFLTNVNETLGEEARYMHMGLTSSDVIDTAFALQIQDCAKIINKDLKTLAKTIKTLAQKHKNTVCIGRSHGIHAEITTFGLKLLNWFDILSRAEKNFKIAQEEIRTGQISGPVGTYSNVPLEVEKLVCKELKLKPARISTQIIARDIHSQFLSALAQIATVIEQFATEIRHLSRTEVMEVAEGFTDGQKGSSAMPHKKNPVLCENLCGLARVVRANSIAALENIVLWHERDISHSSTERIIFPDSLILVDFMLNRFNNVLENLVIKEKRMLQNANLFGGVVYSQKVMLKLIKTGLTREEAYKIVQSHALDALENNSNFKENLLNDVNITFRLSQSEIEECFSQADYLKHVDEIFARFE